MISRLVSFFFFPLIFLKIFFDDFRRVFYARIVSMMKAKLDHWVILASIIMKQAVLNMPTYETAIANANKSISLRFFSFSDKKPSFLLHHSLENMIKEPFWKLTQSWCFKITNIVSYLNFHAKNLNFRAKSGQKYFWRKNSKRNLSFAQWLKNC